LYDNSEEQFAASLAGTRVPPLPPLASESESRTLSGIERTFLDAAASLVEPRPPGDETWRNEVASKVSRYRARRGASDATLSLFEPPPRPQTAEAQARAAAVERVASRFAAPIVEPQPPEPEPPPVVVEPVEPIAAETAAETEEPPRAETNVIEFPKPQPPKPQAGRAMITKDQLQPSLLDELAEPLPATPRILEAPEPEPEPVAPALPAITLDTPVETAPSEDFELPLRVAPVAQRIFSGLIDVTVVLVALAVFGFVALQTGHAVMPVNLATGAAALVAALLWAAYNLMFLIYAGVTPGMQFARLEMRCFDGECLPRATRRGRAIAMLVSAAPLGLGFLWAFFDEDTLCWHDRITQSCVVEAE
jgi:uncharacterized RDD family membrane protein YckC